MLSGEQAQNQNFHDWNKIFIPYCDGLTHTGYSEEPFEFNGKKLYFRGHNNTVAYFDHILNELNMNNASKVVLSGDSAGGIATVKWTDYLASKLKK